MSNGASSVVPYAPVARCGGMPWPRLGERAIRARVGEAGFSRGEMYLAAGRLYDTRRQDRTLRARCEGSSGETYRVSATLDARGVAEAGCSCPIGEDGQCKHTAALLLAWQQQPESFLEAEDVLESLERRSREELLALFRQLLEQYPKLEPALESRLAAERRTQPVPYRERAAAVFRRRGCGSGAVPALAHDLDGLMREGRALAERGDHVGAAAVFEAVTASVLGRARRLNDAGGELASLVAEAIAGMGDCLSAARGDTLAHQAILRALFNVYRFEVEYGPTGHGRRVSALLRERADEDERAAVVLWIRDVTERVEAWTRRQYESFLLDLEGETLEDEAYLALCRETRRTPELLARLLTSGRTEEALAEVARASETDLLKLTAMERVPAEGVEALVAKRVETAPSLSLLEWLRDRYTAQRKALDALTAAERVFRARPDAAGWGALRARAEAIGCWGALREGLVTFLRERNPALLGELLLEEGALDEALSVLRAEPGRAPRVAPARLKLAEQFEGARPRDAIELYAAHVEALIHARGRPNYREAARLAERLRGLQEAQGEGDAWRAWLDGLRERHRELPALQEELSSALEPPPEPSLAS